MKSNGVPEVGLGATVRSLADHPVRAHRLAHVLESLRAEVLFSNAQIRSGWLPVGLDVIRAAISLAARELQALRDQGLAQLVLATEIG